MVATMKAVRFMNVKTPVEADLQVGLKGHLRPEDEGVLRGARSVRIVIKHGSLERMPRSRLGTSAVGSARLKNSMFEPACSRSRPKGVLPLPARMRNAG